MWIDSIDDIELDSSWNEKAQESAKEAQERKDRYSKAMAWIKRTKKDEKKAKKDNDVLFSLVVEILKDDKYDDMLPFIAELIKIWAPSNIIIWWISIVYDPAVYIIRNSYKDMILPTEQDFIKAKSYKELVSYEPWDQIISFDDNNINPNIKNRINAWIEDIINITSRDPSTIITNRFFKLLDDNEARTTFVNFLASALIFFLYLNKFLITKEKAFLYSEFILQEIVKKLKTVHLEEI